RDSRLGYFRGRPAEDFCRQRRNASAQETHMTCAQSATHLAARISRWEPRGISIGVPAGLSPLYAKQRSGGRFRPPPRLANRNCSRLAAADLVGYICWDTFRQCCWVTFEQPLPLIATASLFFRSSGHSPWGKTAGRLARRGWLSRN